MSNAIYLTKSRYAAGLQCQLRLWLNVREPVAWEEPVSGSVEDVGLEIGRMAHLLFPGGVLVEEKPWEHAAAVARTAALMADRSVPAIFEAAFEHSGVRVRVDVLERLPRSFWGIREVKSSGEVKDQHYDDVGVQVHVLKGAGVRLSSVEIVHVNKDYVRGQKEISWPKFFRRVEVRTEARKRLDGIEMRLKKQIGCLSRNRAPKIEPDAHCHAPYSCEHWVRCTASKLVDWVFRMPKLSAARRAGLHALGVESISAIPDDFPLSPRQKIIRDVMQNGKPFVASDLSECLDRFGPPDEDTLLALVDHLPAEAAEALLELATGGKPRAPKPAVVTASPFDHPDAQRRFRVMADVAELQRALDFPWEKWTVFLHPEQRQLVERDYAGPARVAGSAGTGKTIVALHRAAHLARTHPDARVLLTTFSDTLANALRTKLNRLLGNEPRLAERIDVHSLNAIGLFGSTRHTLGRRRLQPARSFAS